MFNVKYFDKFSLQKQEKTSMTSLCAGDCDDNWSNEHKIARRRLLTLGFNFQRNRESHGDLTNILSPSAAGVCSLVQITSVCEETPQRMFQ